MVFPTPLPTHCARRRERWFSRRISRRPQQRIGKALIPD
uniref:Uncharacterized protein n=1 Tax=Cucumis melo TaxID=3656 RepID=A0A9I9E7D0_CUCME